MAATRSRRDRDGREIEVEVHPATLEVMELEYEDEDEDEDYRGAVRESASTDTVAPPRNSLFVNGAPPQATVR